MLARVWRIYIAEQFVHKASGRVSCIFQKCGFRGKREYPTLEEVNEITKPEICSLRITYGHEVCCACPQGAGYLYGI